MNYIQLRKQLVRIAFILVIAACFSSASYGWPEDASIRVIVAANVPRVVGGDVELQGGQGRINTSPQNRANYFVVTKPEGRSARTWVIPTSTIRFDQYNSFTDEWWNTNKDRWRAAQQNMEQPPRQDPAEVQAWLDQYGLSTNMRVYIIDHGQGGKVTSQHLNDFILAELRRKADHGVIQLFRGSERPTESSQWRNGSFARGARYWTSSSDYAWRYARKQPGALMDILADSAPIYRFEFSEQEVVRMLRDGEIVFGCELPKSAHEQFAAQGRFVDIIHYGDFYIGEPDWGVEFEVRVRERGRPAFLKGYRGQVSWRELKEARAVAVQQGVQRLLGQYPGRSQEIEQMRAQRLGVLAAEDEIVRQLGEGELNASLPNGAELLQQEGTSLRSVLDEIKADAAAFSCRRQEGVLGRLAQ